MLPNLAARALQEALCLELIYDGFSRVVEVHLIGEDKNDRPIMLVWQVSGGSSSSESTGWKALKLDDAQSGRLTSIVSKAPRPGFSRQNNAIKTVRAYVE